MKTILKNDLLILVPETPEEFARVAEWKAGRDGFMLSLQANTGAGLSIRAAGPRDDVCREPINVTSRSADPQVKLIGNFAATPFELDGLTYATVESFWQGLRFPEGSERRRIAAMYGSEAKRAGSKMPYGATVTYRGETAVVGTYQHWALMERACTAKFTQNEEAKAALLATGERPLTHRMRRDSLTIPGAIMAEIWMRIRKKLRAGVANVVAMDDEIDELECVEVS